MKRPWINYAPTQSQKETDKFYLSPAWRKLRAFVLSIDPLCYYCRLKGITRLASIGDHYRPRRLFPELQLEIDNIKPCCNECHDKKRRFERDIHTREEFDDKIEKFIQDLTK